MSKHKTKSTTKAIWKAETPYDTFGALFFRGEYAHFVLAKLADILYLCLPKSLNQEAQYNNLLLLEKLAAGAAEDDSAMSKLRKENTELRWLVEEAESVMRSLAFAETEEDWLAGQELMEEWGDALAAHAKHYC